MNKVIPCFYGGYGRYITRFRAFPFKTDCLKLVERRVLLSLYSIASGKKFVKSARVIGDCLGRLHPHGDQSTYGTLVQLVNRGFAEGEGNWGTRGFVEDDDEAAYRYTEVRLAEWVKDLAFKYIDFVPWENFEYGDEPLALPCPIPLGLVGEGIGIGIAFHRSLIPRYTLKDLATRLLWLLENGVVVEDINQSTNISIDTFGPMIKPHVSDCQVDENGPNQFYKILLEGVGSIKTTPYGKIEGNEIYINGRAPLNTFKSLIKYLEDNKDIKYTDSSKSELDVILTIKKGANIQQIASEIWSKHLVKTFNLNNIVCNEKGNISEEGVDNLILNSYNYWRMAKYHKRFKDCQELIQKRFEADVIFIIRNIIQKNQCTSTDQIKQIFNLTKNINQSQSIKFDETTFQWINYTRIITEDDIDKACQKSIKRLVEVNIDITKLNSDVTATLQKFSSLDTDIINEIKNLC